jgi:hypothetical protein
MNDTTKTILTSTVIAGVIGSVTSYITVPFKIDQERYGRQAEAAYIAYVEATALDWQAAKLEENAKATQNPQDIKEAIAKRNESDAMFLKALGTIVAYSPPSVIKAMSNYYTEYANLKKCKDPGKILQHSKVYNSIRSSLGSYGRINEVEIAAIIFQCRMH